MTLQERINQGHMSTYQWGIVLLVTSLNLLDGFDVLALAFTASAIKSSFGLSGVELGYLLSAGLIGMAVGSIVLAPIADTIGRRKLIIFSLLLSTFGMFGSAISMGVLSLGIARVITGLGVGGILVGTNVIVSEYASNKWRNLAISIFASGFGIGAMLGGIFAVALQGTYGWHSVFISGGILTLICLVAVIKWLPESIDFIVLKGGSKQQEQLESIANTLRITEPWTQESKDTSQKVQLPVSKLFSPEYRRPVFAIWIAFAAIMFSYYFVSSWTPALLKEVGMTTEQSVSVGMMISIGGTIGSLIFGVLASRFTARNVLIAFTIGSAIVASVFISVVSHLWIAIVLGICIGALMNGCISGLYAINPTLYEAGLRSTGVGIAIGVGRVGAILAPTIAGVLLDAGWEKQSLYMGAGVVMLVATAAVGVLKNK
ncbi:MAG: MFS transporter [Veillonella sp.]|uniref:MFS transporter n=1 Tax=Veillonella sp. TaxID=1926307 RepID=UPI001B47CAEF|nr:MFS transporter [Veillonella sp.]MBP6923440.1 MFS transporter [Veillonella sp.]